MMSWADGRAALLPVRGLASVGDRIQLLAVLLMARWGRPGAVIAGLIGATLLAQGLSAAGGVLIAGHLPPRPVLLLLALGFLSMGIWSFLPERLPKGADAPSRLGPVLASAAGFFAVEFGDRTQLATMALAARFDAWVMVALGATMGVAIATIPCVLFSRAFLDRLPGRALRIAAASLFILLGIWTALDALRLV
jgi:putative Ca2+/H+ antiporter (TMEM165/GDT1 family)